MHIKQLSKRNGRATGKSGWEKLGKEREKLGKGQEKGREKGESV